MDESEIPSVEHITNTQFEKGGKDSQRILPTDRVVIPAKHEGKNVVPTLSYLRDLGFRPSQLIVLVNGSSEVDGVPDDTAERALSVQHQIVVLHQSALLSSAAKPKLLETLERSYGIKEERLHGKGTAMFAACLALHEQGLPDDARIFFLDADIGNIFDIDPVGRLLYGADQFPSSVRRVQLASLGRDNAGIHAFLASIGGTHSLIGALRWPLCGQVIVHWGDLKHMRLASGYAVEMAMMMDLIERRVSPDVFGEVEINKPLLDKRNSDRVHTRMYTEIMVFASGVHSTGRGLTSLTRKQIRALNRRMETKLWVPVLQMGDGPNCLERRYPDLVFPSITELFASGELSVIQDDVGAIAC